MIMLSTANINELKSATDHELTVIVRLFNKMASMPFQVTDKPGREKAVANAAAEILADRKNAQ